MDRKAMYKLSYGLFILTAKEAEKDNGCSVGKDQFSEGGIAPGTKWEDIPEDFECPLCFVGKDQFSEA